MLHFWITYIALQELDTSRNPKSNVYIFMKIEEISPLPFSRLFHIYKLLLVAWQQQRQQLSTEWKSWTPGEEKENPK